MTFSILVRDEKSGAFGGAATTGSLCVGGWVLRGDAESGLSAAQGTSPSTLWGTDVLALMKHGTSAADAVARVTAEDPGRAHRQLAALDPTGSAGAFTGEHSIDVADVLTGPDCVVAGNMLTSERVLPAVRTGFDASTGSVAERLLAALRAGEAAGGDSRGLLSAALLVVARDAAPLTLRIDYSETPLDDLTALLARVMTEPYASWTRQVPTLRAPYRDGQEPDAPVAEASGR